MSETPSSPPPTTPPPKEGESKTKKYEGDGQPFKGKLIGMEDLQIDRDEKVCLEAMFKLKAVVRARGEHKQRIQLNLTMSAVKVIDDTTKAQIASHEIERISFVVIDPRDTRAFGYIYNTSDDRHQFWAIKTERSAAATVIALKELFELAFEQYTNAEKAKDEANKPITTPPPTSPPIISSEPTVQTQEPAPPSVSDVPPAAPISPPPSVPEPEKSLLDGDIWSEPPNKTVTEKPPQSSSPALVDWDEPFVAVTQPTKVVDPLDELLGDLSPTTTTQAPVTTGTNNALFDIFSNDISTSAPLPPAAAPTPVANQFANLYNQPVQPNLYNPNFLQQQQPVASTSSFPQQQDSLSPRPMSPVAPPSVTSPFAGLDAFSGLSLGAGTGKPTKDSFFPAAPPQKTMQQLLLEKQRNPFS